MNDSIKSSKRPTPSVPGQFTDLRDEVVAIHVGYDDRPFHIHKKLLCSKSTYFNAAFEGSFKEASEKKLHLLDEDSNIFQFYARWIYNQDLELGGKEHEMFDVDACCHVYILADKLGSESLQNLVMDVIHHNAITYRRSSPDHLTTNRFINLCSETINYVYDNTPPSSHLRDILVHTLAWEIQVKKLPDLCNAPSEFLFAALEICSYRLPYRLKGEKGPLDKDLCATYHFHSDGHSCAAPPPVVSKPANQS
ncbi:MAG: hypothetical protein Q9168_006149 [Polycauliona sp. 1 TL-2023]